MPDNSSLTDTPKGGPTGELATVEYAISPVRQADLVLVDEIRNLNLATAAGEDMSDHLKYFTEHPPSTFVYAGINLERSGLFTGVRGKQIAGRCVLASTGPFPYQQEWKSLVAAMESALRLHRHQPGTFPAMDRYLHQRTGGMIGSLSHLVRAEAIMAILNGSEAITQELSSTASRSATPPSRCGSDRMTAAALSFMLRTAPLLPLLQGLRRWASTPPVSRRNRQPATGPPGSYPDRTTPASNGELTNTKITVDLRHGSPPILLGARMIKVKCGTHWAARCLLPTYHNPSPSSLSISA